MLWKKILCALLMAFLFIPAAALAGGASFTCYGEDLTADQYEQVLTMLGTDPDSDRMIAVTIEDEKALLEGVVDREKMGSKSISSARVTLEEEGKGISVTTQNINWVTSSMYASALATAGVQNAKVVVAAPTEVSGTAALAGILKAYEQAADVQLSETAKALAGEELVATGNLADLIGTDQAEELLGTIKREIAERGLDKEENVRPLIREAAKQLGVALTDEQVETLTGLMVRIAKLDLDPQKLAEQLNSLNQRLTDLQELKEGTMGFFDKLKTGVQGFFDWVGGWLSKLKPIR